jgi:hypothetical protein
VTQGCVWYLEYAQVFPLMKMAAVFPLMEMEACQAALGLTHTLAATAVSSKCRQKMDLSTTVHGMQQLKAQARHTYTRQPQHYYGVNK